MQAFLIYIDDWLSSKKIEMMDELEELAYFHMLMKAAKEPDCGLPDDDNMLAVISGLGAQWFKPTKERLKRFGAQTSGAKIRQSFFSKDGRIFNERLLREFEHQKTVNEKRSAAGVAGASKRWSKDGNGSGNPDGKRIANGIANEKQNDANHSLGLGLSIVSKEKIHLTREELTLDDGRFNFLAAFAEFVDGWPDMSELEWARQYYMDKVLAKPDPWEAHAKMLAAKERWVRSKRWHRGYHKSPGKWLAEDKQADFPEPCSCGQRVHTQDAQARDGPKGIREMLTRPPVEGLYEEGL